MIRFGMIVTCAAATFLMAGGDASAQAPIQTQPATLNAQQAQAIQQVGHHRRPLVPTLPAAHGQVAMGHNPNGMYPQLNAPLYPSPQPNTPTYVGGTYITNQALAPHEMLYPHDYHAMYGPYYWRVKGSWIVTPLGVRSHEKWQLQGTQVRVKYRSQKPFLSGFVAPSSH